MTQLQIADDKKQITEKKSVISACNVDYKLKRSGPIGGKILKEKFLYLPIDDAGILFFKNF